MRTDYQPKPRVRPRPDHEKANGKVLSAKDKKNARAFTKR